MLNNDAWINVADVLTSRDFYRTQHQIIFEVMASLANVNDPLDAVTLSEALSRAGCSTKRAASVSRRTRGIDTRRKQRTRLCADRARTFDVAAADFGRQQNR